jgi:hypothetical protein
MPIGQRNWTRCRSCPDLTPIGLREAEQPIAHRDVASLRLIEDKLDTRRIDAFDDAYICTIKGA